MRISLLLMAVWLYGILPTQAQSQPKKLDIKGCCARFSPDGKRLLLTSENMIGLRLYDLATGQQIQLSDAPGAGYEPYFEGDEQVVFTEKGAGRSQLKRMDLRTRKAVALSTQVSPAEWVGANAQRLKGNTATFAASTPMLDGIRLRQADGKEQLFAPMGKGQTYIWVSLSPDRSKVLFKVVGDAAYLMDLQGRILQRLGNWDHPRWAGPDQIVYMQAEEQYNSFTKSDVFLYRITTRTTLLLTEHTAEIALQPDVSAGRLVFNTPAGEVFIMALD